MDNKKKGVWYTRAYSVVSCERQGTNGCFRELVVGCSVPQNRDLGVRTEGPLGGPPSPVFGKDWSGFTASLFVFVILGIMSIYLDNLRVHIFVLFWGCILILSAFWDIYTGLSCQRVSGFLKIQ